MANKSAVESAVNKLSQGRPELDSYSDIYQSLEWYSIVQFNIPLDTV